MAKPTSPIEFNSFSKGLNTDSSPLNYQPDSAQVLKNYVLNLDGSVQRRNGRSKLLQDMTGIDASEAKESSLTQPYTLISDYVKSRSGIKWFRWKNLGDNGDIEILAISHKKDGVSFFEVGESSIKQIPFSTFTSDKAYAQLPASGGASGFFNNNVLDFSQIGDDLVVVNGNSDIKTFRYSQSSGSVSEGPSYRLKVRDTWPIMSDSAMPSSGRDYDPSYRPYEEDFNLSPYVKANYLYGLMNKGWGQSMLLKSSTDKHDPVTAFKIASNALTLDGGRYPSNSEVFYNSVYPNTANTANPTVDRFQAVDAINNAYSKSESPLGAFVIDLFDRKESRKAAAARVTSDSVTNGWALIPSNITGDYYSSGGPTCTASYAGRVWYSGMNNEGLEGGNSNSPNLSKLVMFSQLVSSTSDAFKCYQEGDPTNPDTADLVDTDGGFIPIQEVGTIYKLVPFGRSLLVIADNGVWAINGTSESGFTATSYSVDKVSEEGCIAVNSVVVTKSGLFYLAKSGIVVIAGNQIDGLKSSSLSEGVIDKKVSRFTNLEQKTFSGCYDEFNNRVIWNYINLEGAEELIFDLNLGAFYTHVWEGSIEQGNVLPVMTIPLKEPNTGLSNNQVVAGPDIVVVNGDPVVVSESAFNNEGVTTINVIHQIANSVVNTGFALETPSKFYDWDSFDTNQGLWNTPQPIDASGEIVTGALTGGDTQRFKQVPYLTMHFQRTEYGFEEVGDDLIPLGQSSCKVQPQWEWTNSASSNRWGKEFQAYRYTKFYMPNDGSDSYGTGQAVITTKNKLRGKGRALSLRMSTEAGKDCRLLGWALNIGINNVV